MKAVLKLVLTAMFVWSLGIALSVIAADTAQGAPRIMPPGVKALNAPGIHNVFALGTNVYSGSSPEGDEAFAALAKLEVKTIITVDGTKPKVELAHKYGMRYVHIPHGYDGVGTNAQAHLAKAAQTVPGPIFVHCHHGLHRGPTGSALSCSAVGGRNSRTVWYSPT